MTKKEATFEVDIDTYPCVYESVITASNVHDLLDRIYADMENDIKAAVANELDYPRRERQVGTIILQQT